MKGISFIYLRKRFAPQAALGVWLENAQLHEAYHRSLLDAAVRLLGAVGHQLRQQVSLLDERVLLLERLDGLRARRQHRHENAFRR